MNTMVKIMALSLLFSVTLFARVKVTPDNTEVLATESQYSVLFSWSDNFVYNGEVWQNLYQKNMSDAAFLDTWARLKNTQLPESFVAGMNTILTSTEKKAVLTLDQNYTFNVAVLSLDATGAVEVSISIVTTSSPSVVLMTVTGVVGSSTLTGTQEELMAEAFKNAGILFAEKVLIN